MCGIVGLLSQSAIDTSLLSRMARAIDHRGPDDDGVWADDDGAWSGAGARIGLGHRRLSIVDLSTHGHQPMASSNGRWMLSYNGEIYNHRALRAALEGEGCAPEGGWSGHSDTETLIEAITHWGLAAAIERAVGMFAFALWDRKLRQLHLCRDRFGEKPLYYGWAGKDFVFASELKAIRVHPSFVGDIDRHALAQYAARTCVPAPLSIYRRLFKLPPGTFLTVAGDRVPAPRDAPPVEAEHRDGLTLTRYWSYRTVIEQGLADPIAAEQDALVALEQVLAQAIGDQAVADVPVGAFLSGGIDSSTVIALYQKYSSIPVRTFSIGFDEAGFDEAVHAKAVAAQLGTVHTEHYVSVAEARDVIPLLPRIYDEPFADSSQIPTYLVSRFARSDVTVALTGDGGDELFGGYNRHIAAPQMWQRLNRVPAPLRGAAGGVLGQVPAQWWQGALSLLGRASPALSGGKVQKGLRTVGQARSFDDVYRSFLDEWAFENSPVIGGGSGHGASLSAIDGVDDSLRMMLCDATSYLPDDILTKVDRASMAVSLETRVPFLDHRVAALAARIPTAMKIRNGVGKHILRELLFAQAPRALFERPKAGFAVPVGQWIRGPLRDWAESLLDPRQMAAEGWFDTVAVQQRWRDHLSGRRDSTPAIWSVLMFQAWLAEQRQSVSAAA